jgi:hypothetical protein
MSYVAAIGILLTAVGVLTYARGRWTPDRFRRSAGWLAFWLFAVGSSALANLQLAHTPRERIAFLTLNSITLLGATIQLLRVWRGLRRHGVNQAAGLPSQASSDEAVL